MSASHQGRKWNSVQMNVVMTVKIASRIDRTIIRVLVIVCGKMV